LPVALWVQGGGFHEEEINRFDAYHYQRTLLFTELPLPMDASVYRVGAEWGYHEEGIKPEAWTAANNVSVSRNMAAIFGPVYCTVSVLVSLRGFSVQHVRHATV
jgi:hypothetical protein